MKYAVLALLGLIEVNAMTNQERVNGAFNRMDRNGDNVITPNEFPGSRAAFNKPDYNGDGQVTRAELLKYAVSKFGNAVEDMGEDELINMMTNQDRVNGAFKRLDKNGDNVVTANEFPGSQAAFNKPDYNGDGQVTRSELLKYAKSKFGNAAVENMEHEDIVNLVSSNATNDEVMLFNLPNISVDKTKVQTALQGLEQWGKRDQAARQVDNQENFKNLIHAAAVWDTEEYVSFGQTWKSYVDFEVKMIDSLTVAGTCDQNAATLCLNTWIMQGADKNNTSVRDQCFKTAGCTVKFEQMTPADQQALATSWNTSVSNIQTAYSNIWAQTEADLKKSWAAHQVRKAAIEADGKASVKKFATDMGCNQTCIDSCVAQIAFNAQCFSNCNCGQGVITVSPAVNTAAIVEKVYGNVHNLS